MSTLANLRTVVSAKLGLDNTASSAEQALMDIWANEAVRRVLLRTHLRVQSATLTLTSGSADYELPSSVLALTKVLNNTSGEPLEHVSPEEIHDLRRSGSASSSPSYRYAIAGANLLLVWPTPAAADTLKFYYVPKPTEMSDGTHDPSSTTYGGIPVEHHKAIELWMLAEGADYDDDQTAEQGKRYRDLFEAECLEIKRQTRFRGGRLMSPMRLGRRPRRPLAPSQDW